ncbi:MAG: PIN domain-containing protein [Burkholderiales bacterium]|nr:PIN domain-containing protein [Burkholderiales bacterium]
MSRLQIRAIRAGEFEAARLLLAANGWASRVSDSQLFAELLVRSQIAIVAVEGEVVVTTRLVLQELLQGFSGPKAKAAIIDRFAALPPIQPDRQDHVAAAEVRNVCRQGGVQVGTIDALLMQLCGRYDLTLLSSDQDFAHAAPLVPFRLWGQG